MGKRVWVTPPRMVMFEYKESDVDVKRGLYRAKQLSDIYPVICA